VHVAGLALRPDAGATASPSDEPVLLDWLLSQSSIRIEGGALQWTDERRPAPTLGLANVDLHLQSGRGWRGRVHQISFAATPPASFGQRLSVSGRMTQPHWQWEPWQAEAGRQSTSMPASTPTPWWGFMPHASDWRTWSGVLDVQLPHVDVQSLRQHVDMPVDVRGGRGHVQAALALAQGRLQGLQAKVNVRDLHVRL